MEKKLSPVEKILSRIGKRVLYQYPGDEGDRRGVLKDRAVVSAGRNPTGVHYWHIVDLIEFSDHREPWIRIGYYRRPKEHLVFAGQTTSTHRVSQWKHLFVNAAKEKKWFRKLLEDVAEELKK